MLHMFRYLLLIAVTLSVVGCKYVPKLDQVLPDKRSEYKKSSTLPDLEVPPDLSTEAIHDKMAVPDEGSATFSTYQERVAARKKQREAGGGVENAVTALSGEQVIVAEGDVPTVWEKLHAFWKEKGYALNLDDQEYGVQETEWREDKTNLTRDRFKVFVEAGEKAGTTTLYFSHEGEEQKPDGEKLAWQPRGRDESLEGRMVAEIKRSLGIETNELVASRTDADAAPTPAAPAASSAAAGDDGKTWRNPDAAAAASDHEAGTAAAPEAAPQTGAISAMNPRAAIVNNGGGRMLLALQEEFADAWTSTGTALSRAGVTVDEMDKPRGIYHVRYASPEPHEKKGMLSKLKFWDKGPKEQQFQISLTGVGKKTEIVVLDNTGKWDVSDGAYKILNLLQTELNKST
ncbi:MAG TPA: outer membrane protein assembly factor BamC [Gammaproteobacteria bacterium]|nr:outer membrane protein assembly factor BamC [Gammaproteobacteria bacterium]